MKNKKKKLWKKIEIEKIRIDPMEAVLACCTMNRGLSGECPSTENRDAGTSISF